MTINNLTLIWEVRAVPRLCELYTLAFALQLKKSTENPQLV
jgi:hypothetical protein